jgi:leucyl/phenylalanyl-tRNA--protein transferase
MWAMMQKLRRLAFSAGTGKALVSQFPAMPLYRLSRELVFPPPDLASEEGVLAIGGDLAPERLVLAYSQGIFPWPFSRIGLLWFSPDPRYVIEPTKAHLHRSLRKKMRTGAFEVRADTAFAEVIAGCAKTPRRHEQGTWITEDMRTAYQELHEQGIAHSIESWRDDRLAGGLYGVSLGRVFYGESMFALEPDASKVAMGTLLGNLVAWDFALVDCQVHTEHLERFGAVGWPRRKFLVVLQKALDAPTRRGKWQLELDAAAAVGRIKGNR